MRHALADQQPALALRLREPPSSGHRRAAPAGRTAAALRRRRYEVGGSTLSIIPGAGHLPTLEQPKITNRILEKWLRM